MKRLLLHNKNTQQKKVSCQHVSIFFRSAEISKSCSQGLNFRKKKDGKSFPLSSHQGYIERTPWRKRKFCSIVLRPRGRRQHFRGRRTQRLEEGLGRWSGRRIGQTVGQKSGP